MIFLAFFIIMLLLFGTTLLRISFMILLSIDGDGIHLEIKVMFYKLFTLFQWNLKEGGLSFLMKKKQDVPDDPKKEKGRLYAILDIIFSKDAYRHLKKGLEVFDVSVKGRLASKDAALTALIYGEIWGILGSLIPFIPQKHLMLDFYPDFNKETPDFHVSCILRVRIIHIIVLIIENKRKNIRKDRGGNYGTASY